MFGAPRCAFLCVGARAGAPWWRTTRQTPLIKELLRCFSVVWFNFRLLSLAAFSLGLLAGYIFFFGVGFILHFYLIFLCYRVHVYTIERKQTDGENENASRSR